MRSTGIADTDSYYNTQQNADTYDIQVGSPIR